MFCLIKNFDILEVKIQKFLIIYFGLKILNQLIQCQILLERDKSS
jgi:hypothetical protein